jgi:thiol:disulfide interchange protein DsbD
METLRQIMGFPMMGAALWMLFVLSALAGSPAMIRVLAALLVSGMGAWIWGRWGGLEKPRASRLGAAILGLILVLGSTAFAIDFVRRASSLPAAAASPGATPVARVASSWEAWSPEKVAELRRQGTPVFIDFTARWCLSCQVNERLTLDNPGVKGRFAELGIATLRADWTDRSDSIAQGIAGYGRAGIPLYVLYGRGARDAVLLPEVLTPGIVLAALEKAR